MTVAAMLAKVMTSVLMFCWKITGAGGAGGDCIA